MKCTIKLIVILLVIFTIFSLTAVPGTINFQGALKDANGVPVNDTQIMEFRIYDDPDAGSLLWSEQNLAVEIVDGIFSEELGDDTVFPASMFDNPELYITFFFGGDEMTPRQKLLSVPYTLLAENAEAIEDVPLAGLVQQDGDENATINGTMTADAFLGDGSGLTNISGAFDPLYVNTAGPDMMTANTTTGVLNIENTNASGKGINISDAGYGLYVENADQEGVVIDSAGSAAFHVGYAGDDGVHVHNAGTPSSQTTSSDKNGFDPIRPPTLISPITEPKV